jgi:hypothetical protein
VATAEATPHRQLHGDPLVLGEMRATVRLSAHAADKRVSRSRRRARISVGAAWLTSHAEGQQCQQCVSHAHGLSAFPRHRGLHSVRLSMLPSGLSVYRQNGAHAPRQRGQHVLLQGADMRMVCLPMCRAGAHEPGQLDKCVLLADAHVRVVRDPPRDDGLRSSSGRLDSDSSRPRAAVPL